MYTTKEASAPAAWLPLLRAWEWRYGVVLTGTTAGYWLWDDAAIGRLRAMRQLIALAWTLNQGAQRVRDRTCRVSPLD